MSVGKFRQVWIPTLIPSVRAVCIVAGQGLLECINSCGKRRQKQDARVL